MINGDEYSFEEIVSDVLVETSTEYAISIEDQDIDSFGKAIKLFRIDPEFL